MDSLSAYIHDCFQHQSLIIFLRGTLYKNDTLGYWGVSFPSDEPVVYRTQRYRYEVLGERPIQFQQFLRMPSVLHGALLLLGMAYFALLSSFAWTRNLLFKVSTILHILYVDKVYVTPCKTCFFSEIHFHQK